MKARIHFSRSCRRRLFTDQAKDIAASQVFDVPADKLSAEDRALLHDLPELDNSTNLPGRELTIYNAPLFKADIFPVVPEDWEQLLTDFRVYRENALAENEAQIALHKQKAQDWVKRAEAALQQGDNLVEMETLPFDTVNSLSDGEKQHYHSLREEIATKVKERQEAERKAQQEARTAERIQWVSGHGSDYLKKAVAAGYDCQRKYVEERATLELPDYMLDFDDDFRWKDRSCPAESTLDEALRVGGKVVWLPNKSCEAVVVQFLGQYNLLRLYTTE